MRDSSIKIDVKSKGSSINIDMIINNITARIQERLPEAKNNTLKKIAEDTEEYVPYKTGRLSKSKEINGVASEINYNAEYASYAFNPLTVKGNPKKYNQEVNSKAQGNPYDASTQAHDLEWVEYFREELMKGVN